MLLIPNYKKSRPSLIAETVRFFSNEMSFVSEIFKDVWLSNGCSLGKNIVGNTKTSRNLLLKNVKQKCHAGSLHRRNHHHGLVESRHLAAGGTHCFDHLGPGKRCRHQGGLMEKKKRKRNAKIFFVCVGTLQGILLPPPRAHHVLSRVRY